MGKCSWSPPTNDSATDRANEFAISTVRTPGFNVSGSKVEEGIGLHANGALTFDLDELRNAGKITPNSTYRFIADRAGINDGTNGGGSVRLIALVSGESGILSGHINGQPVTVASTSGVWSFNGTIPAAMTAATPPVPFDIPISSDARFLTLIVTSAGNGNGLDHGVFSGARLIPHQFTIEVSAPIAGQTHESSTYPDRDFIRGGDGDDTIAGNSDLDTIYGGSGVDQFTAEPIEVHDRDVDRIDILPGSADLMSGNSAPVLDPIIAIPDVGLSAALAKAVGNPTISPARSLKFDGVDDFVRIPNFGNQSPTTEITIEFWQRVDSKLIKAPSSFLQMTPITESTSMLPMAMAKSCGTSGISLRAVDLFILRRWTSLGPGNTSLS